MMLYVCKLEKYIQNASAMERAQETLDYLCKTVGSGFVRIHPGFASCDGGARDIMIREIFVHDSLNLMPNYEYFEGICAECARRGLAAFDTFIVVVIAARQTPVEEAVLDSVRGLLKSSLEKNEYLGVVCRAIRRALFNYPKQQIEEWTLRAPVVNASCRLPSDSSFVSCEWDASCAPRSIGSSLIPSLLSDSFRFFSSLFCRSTCDNAPSSLSLCLGETAERCIVDRTFYIPYFLMKGGTVILRPRRFGKSFWLSTLRAFFTTPHFFIKQYAVGQMCFQIGKTLWDPLKSRPDIRLQAFESCPVLLFDFSGMPASTAEWFKAHLLTECQLLANRSDIRVVFDETDTWVSLLERIIAKLSNNLTEKRVVVLVDEYDYNLVRSLDSASGEDFKALKDVHSEFFTLLKTMAPGILMRCITGITRWELAGLFSRGSDLDDQTLDPCLSQLIGFTELEVMAIAESHGGTEPAKLFNIFKENCSGYSFSDLDVDHQVFNPFYIRCEVEKLRQLRGVATTDLSLLPDNCPIPTNAAVTGSPGAHWCQSADISIAKKYFDLISDFTVPIVIPQRAIEFASPESNERHKSESALFYMGYLAIKRFEKRGDEMCYHLDFPNPGVRKHFVNDFLRSLERYEPGEDLVKLLDAADFLKLFNTLNRFMMQVPYFLLWNITREAHAQLGLYMYFARTRGLVTAAEDLNSEGRADLIITSPKTSTKPGTTLVIELKMERNDNTLKFRETAEIGVLQCRLRSYGVASEPNARVYRVGAVVAPKKSTLSVIVFESEACLMFGEFDPQGEARLGEKPDPTSVRAGEMLHHVCLPSRNEFYMRMLYGWFENERLKARLLIKKHEEEKRDMRAQRSSWVLDHVTKAARDEEVKNARAVLEKNHPYTRLPPVIERAFRKNGINALSLMSVNRSHLVAMGFSNDDSLEVLRSINFAKPKYGQLFQFRDVASEDDKQQLVLDFVADDAQRKLAINALWNKGSVHAANTLLGTRLAVEALRHMGFPESVPMSDVGASKRASTQDAGIRPLTTNPLFSQKSKKART